VTILRRPGAALATLLILLMGAAFLTQVVPYRQMIDSRRQVEDARSQLAALQTDNERLQADIDALNTPGEIEKLAREKLGYVRPGETSYVVVSPPDDLRTQAAPPAADEDTEIETWVDRLWGFISGGDLASGG